MYDIYFIATTPSATTAVTTPADTTAVTTPADTTAAPTTSVATTLGPLTFDEAITACTSANAGDVILVKAGTYNADGKTIIYMS